MAIPLLGTETNGGSNPTLTRIDQQFIFYLSLKQFQIHKTCPMLFEQLTDIKSNKAQMQKLTTL